MWKVTIVLLSSTFLNAQMFQITQSTCACSCMEEWNVERLNYWITVTTTWRGTLSRALCAVYHYTHYFNMLEGKFICFHLKTAILGLFELAIPVSGWLTWVVCVRIDVLSNLCKRHQPISTSGIPWYVTLPQPIVINNEIVSRTLTKKRRTVKREREISLVWWKNNFD